MRVTRTFAVASAAAIALGALATAGPALADGTTTPADNTIVAVGSDTIQYVADAFQANYTGTPGFFSFDATGTSPIQTKSDTGTSPCVIARPNGSSSGINQLTQRLGTNNTLTEPGGFTSHYACVDTSRASRPLGSSDANWLTEVLFAQDLITWSSNTGGNAVSNLTDTQLKAIYSCDASLLGTGKTGPVTWNEVGGTSADEITAVLPQNGSGTRATWLSDIFGSSVPTSFGSCVVNGTFNNVPVEENEGTNAVFTSTGNPTHKLTDGNFTGYQDIVFGFSGGDWLCEANTSNCGTQGTVEGNLALKNIDGKAPTKGSPAVLNIGGLSAFPTTYIRGLFFVTYNGGTQTAPQVADPSTPPGAANWPIPLRGFLGNGNNTGYICSTAGQNIVASFGFTKPSNCGALLNSTPTPTGTAPRWFN